MAFMEQVRLAKLGRKLEEMQAAGGAVGMRDVDEVRQEFAEFQQSWYRAGAKKPAKRGAGQSWDAPSGSLSARRSDGRDGARIASGGAGGATRLREYHGKAGGVVGGGTSGLGELQARRRVLNAKKKVNRTAQESGRSKLLMARRKMLPSAHIVLPKMEPHMSKDLSFRPKRFDKGVTKVLRTTMKWQGDPLGDKVRDLTRMPEPEPLRKGYRRGSAMACKELSGFVPILPPGERHSYMGAQYLRANMQAPRPIKEDLDHPDWRPTEGTKMFWLPDSGYGHIADIKDNVSRARVPKSVRAREQQWKHVPRGLKPKMYNTQKISEAMDDLERFERRVHPKGSKQEKANDALEGGLDAAAGAGEAVGEAAGKGASLKPHPPPGPKKKVTLNAKAVLSQARRRR